MMDCKSVRKAILKEGPGAESAGHLSSCSACSQFAVEQAQLGAALRQMPKRMPPARLSSKLRVVASRERMRAMGSGLTWQDRVRMFVKDLMRPFAVPAFGGLASAVVLFSALMPSLAMPLPAVHDDVPISLVTEPSVKYFAPIGIRESELVVDLLIDETGRMVDYTVVRGQNLLEDQQLRRELENQLVFTEFVPATKFGGPASGKVRLWIKSSQINIKG